MGAANDVPGALEVYLACGVASVVRRAQEVAIHAVPVGLYANCSCITERGTELGVFLELVHVLGREPRFHTFLVLCAVICNVCKHFD